MLKSIDKEIHKCNICNDMVEKFPNAKTVSIGKDNKIVILGEAPANNGWRKSGVAWYDINHKLLPSGVVLQKLLKEIGYFSIIIPLVGFVIGIITGLIVGPETVEVSNSMYGFFMGIIVLCLTQFFTHGVVIDKDYRTCSSKAILGIMRINGV